MLFLRLLFLVSAAGYGGEQIPVKVISDLYPAMQGIRMAGANASVFRAAGLSGQEQSQQSESSKMLLGKYRLHGVGCGQDVFHIEIAANGQITGLPGIGSFMLLDDPDHLYKVSGDVISLQANSEEENIAPELRRSGWYYLEKEGEKALLYKAELEEHVVRKGKLAFVLTRE